MRRLEVFPVEGLPEVAEGTNLAELISGAFKRAGLDPLEGDVFVIKQKIVSKAEGRAVKLESVRPGARAKRLAKEQGKDPRLVELVLRESRKIVRAKYGIIIAQTKLGYVCANAGIDRSNVKEGYALLLPADPDGSARRIRRGLERRLGVKLAVVITDTFGRPWRWGQTDVAIGASGIAPLFSYKGKKDFYGYTLRVTEPAIVDEIAGAAELVTGKLNRVPVAVVRGADYRRGEQGARSIVMSADRDLFWWTR